MENRDKKKYRHNGLRDTSVNTVMGEIKYKRVMYEGWKKDDPRHSLVNKQYIAGIMKLKEFSEMRCSF